MSGCDSDVNEGKYQAVEYLTRSNNYAELLQSLKPETYLGSFSSPYTCNALKQYI